MTTTAMTAQSLSALARMYLVGTGATAVAFDVAAVHAAAVVAINALTVLPRRLAHTCGVATATVDLTHLITDPIERDAVLAAAWVHDIGYSPALVATGLHPVDGATYLRRHGFPELVVSLVAHHTGAAVEAAHRGLSGELEVSAVPPAPLLDILTVADLSTTPDGDPTSCDHRIAEILTRYPPGHLVHTAVTESAPALRAADRRVRARLGDAYRTAHTTQAPKPPTGER